MTDDVDARDEFVCPRCQAQWTPPADASGSAVQCPECGKFVRLPGTEAATPEKAPAASKQIAVVCPICQTRLYADSGQVGDRIVCPDCLESIEVKAAPARTYHPTSPPPGSDVPPEFDESGSPVAPVDATESDASDDEYRLAPDEEDAPPPAREQESARGPFGMQLDVSDEPAGDETDDEEYGLEASDARPSLIPSALREDLRDDVSAGPARPRNPRGTNEDTDFGFLCPVCDTRMFASIEQIGQTKVCPDCMSEVAVPTPSKKSPRDRPAAHEEGDELSLAPAEDIEVYREAAERVQKESARAQLEHARKKQEEHDEELPPELPPVPLIQGVLSFLRYPSTWGRVVLLGILLSVEGAVIYVAVEKLGEEVAMAFFAALFCFVLATFIGLIGGATASALLLAVLQDSANGEDEIENWPGTNFMDWIPDAVYLIAPLTYAAAPGLLLMFVAALLPLHSLVGAVLVGISIFVCFPVTVLSVLESSSLANGVSAPVIASIRANPLAWGLQYAISGGLLIGAVLVCLLLLVESVAVMIPIGFTLSLLLILYFRVIGRLGWWCAEIMNAAETAAEAERTRQAEQAKFREEQAARGEG